MESEEDEEHVIGSSRWDFFRAFDFIDVVHEGKQSEDLPVA